MQLSGFLFSLLAVAPALVSAAEPFVVSVPLPNSENGLAVTTAEFAVIANSAECQNPKSNRNPFRNAIYIDGKSHAEGIQAWLDYFSQLPEKCHPKPYELAIADGKTTEEAERAQAAYVKVKQLAARSPILVDSYYQEVFQGKTPAQAYLHWIEHRKGWTSYEWQPESDAQKQ